MKKSLLFILSCCMILTTYAQNIVKEHYTVSGGLLGGVNLSKFRVTGESNAEFKRRTGFGGGIWVNFPVNNTFSVEPQLMFNKYLYTTDNMAGTLMNRGEANYISLPVLLKFQMGEIFAITLGPQVDFLTSIHDQSNVAKESDFKQTSLSVSGGVELFPRARFTLFGRYLFGITNMDDRTTASESMEFKNSNIQLGMKVRLFGKKIEADSDGDGVIDKNDKCPTVIGVARYGGCPIPDTDGDGINDELDKCPSVAGTAKYDGCPIPDTDKDGINDEQDKCPTVPGTAKYEGCPVPDTDGDGINDENDKCPSQPGPASREGCPLTDTDNDGIADEEDKCPTVAGTASNNGCPDIDAAVIKTLGAAGQNISFGSGNAKLTTKSNATLNKLVTIMNENPTLKLKIEGHTDNSGNDDANMTLSEARAEAVKAYLVSKGISEDRIDAEGFGESQPIAENTTVAGRTKNRRVEIKVNN